MIVGVDHIGVVVSSIKEAKKVYCDALGLPIEEMAPVAGRAVNIAFVMLGNTKIELVEPVDPQSRQAQFLATRGEGINHIALKVTNIEADLAALKAKGMPLVDETPRTASSGAKIAYLHPSGARGVSIELIQPKNPE
ncbi:MAG: methylmalonyl-CoA epimerase [Dehalococcoidales bacterium]|nr:methylmalonyl-CoA epimerase [Dehalococcoidales bacterium]